MNLNCITNLVAVISELHNCKNLRLIDSLCYSIAPMYICSFNDLNIKNFKILHMYF